MPVGPGRDGSLPWNEPDDRLASLKISRAARYNPRGLRLRVRLRRLFFPAFPAMCMRSGPFRIGPSVKIEDPFLDACAREPRSDANSSVRPVLVDEGRLVQLVAASAPLRHEVVHQASEPVVVGPFDEVDHLVHQDVLEA